MTTQKPLTVEGAVDVNKLLKFYELKQRLDNFLWCSMMTAKTYGENTMEMEAEKLIADIKMIEEL